MSTLSTDNKQAPFRNNTLIPTINAPKLSTSITDCRKRKLPQHVQQILTENSIPPLYVYLLENLQQIELPWKLRNNTLSSFQSSPWVYHHLDHSLESSLPIEVLCLLKKLEWRFRNKKRKLDLLASFRSSSTGQSITHFLNSSLRFIIDRVRSPASTPTAMKLELGGRQSGSYSSEHPRHIN